jgi:hypothetical protein
MLLDCALALGFDCTTNASLSPPNVIVPRASGCLAAVRHGSALKEWVGNITSPAGTFQSWNGPDPCSLSAPWRGVSCSRDAVIRIDLSGLNLTGPIGAKLARVETLQVYVDSGPFFCNTLILVMLYCMRLGGFLPCAYCALNKGTLHAR